DLPACPVAQQCSAPARSFPCYCLIVILPATTWAKCAVVPQLGSVDATHFLWSAVVWSSVVQEKKRKPRRNEATPGLRGEQSVAEGSSRPRKKLRVPQPHRRPSTGGFNLTS